MILKKDIYNYTAGSIFAAVFSILIFQIGWLDKLENIFYDMRVKLLSQSNIPSKNIKLIVIDQNSLKWAEQSNGIGWPWPREMYSALNGFLEQSGARGVVYDLIFSESSFYGKSDDEYFAGTLKLLPSLGAIVLTDAQNARLNWPKNLKLPEQLRDFDCIREKDKRVILPVSPIMESFESFGFVNILASSDGVIRKIVPCYEFEGKKIATLPLEAFKMVSDKKINPKIEKGYINFNDSPFSFKTFSAASIIDSWLSIQDSRKPLVSMDEFKDCIVFIGVSASGLHDNKATPLSNNHPGVDIQATILDNLIQNNVIYKTSYSVLFILIFISSLLSAFFIYRFKTVWKISLSLGVFISVLFLGSVLLYKQNIWLETAPVLFSMILSSIITAILGYILEGRQKRFIKNAFTHYLSPKVVQNLIDDPEQLLLGGKTRCLSIFFSDIAGFTSISEKLEPQKVVSLLNDYLDEMSDIVLNFDGTIDKYEGDAIIAFWNAPVEQKDHATLAVKAAIEYQNRLEELDSFFNEKYGVSIRVRVGIHTGDVVVGNLGSQKRFDYSFVGDAGNLASRLEGTNKFFKTRILFSKDTLDMLTSQIPYRKIATVQVVGKKKPIEVFEPLLKGFALSKEELDDFSKAVAFFEKGDHEKALEIFQTLAPKDEVSNNYINIVDSVRNKKILWDNAIVLDTK